MKNAILYTRVSTDDQADGCSLNTQEQHLRNYCTSQDFNVIAVYKEDYCAKNHDLDRPEFRKMFEYCKRHKKSVDIILFLRWDRYSRNLEFATTYKRKIMDELGIEINSIESPIDFEGTEWSMLLGVYCGVAHTEDEKISRRTKEGIRSTLLAGRWPNKAPRGYKNVRVSKHDCRIEIDKEKAPLIKNIFEEVAHGSKAPCYIRRQMCPSIPESSYLDMLRNIFYIGKVRVPSTKKEPEKIVNGIHEPIVDESVFYKVQDILDGKKKKTPKLTKTINPDLYLRRFLVCPICGHAITGATSHGNGGYYTYYNCCHVPKHIRKSAQEVNEGFCQYVSCLKPNQTILNLYKEIILDIHKEGKKAINADISKLQKELSLKEQRLISIEDKFLDEDISKSEYAKMKSRIEDEKKELKSKIETLELNNKEDIEEKLKYSISLISNLGSFFREATTEVKIQLLGSIFPEKIEFDGKNYRTNCYNKVLDLIYQQTNELRGNSIKKNEENLTSPQFSTQSRGRTGTDCSTGV